MIVEAGYGNPVTAIQKPGDRTIDEWLVILVDLLSGYADAKVGGWR